MESGLERKAIIVEESEKTKKARAKLNQKLKAIDEKITSEALKKKRAAIHGWIARNASYRIVLREKSISLFDENQNTAKLSEKVTKVAEQIRKE
ncbi:MAG: hypothetical protein L0207_00920 [Chlamydiae bacterium]|nr:hypothetical protein [Chlamydiota bacterium]